MRPMPFDVMNTDEIVEKLKNQFGQNILRWQVFPDNQLCVEVQPAAIMQVCAWLRTSPDFYFDSLSCLTGIDNGAQADTMEVVYQLYSIPFHRFLSLKVTLSRQKPHVPSVVQVWRTADWHEREAYDLFGIVFENHPDLRRILMPEDWQGFPLRKDYQVQEFYHDVKVQS